MLLFSTLAENPSGKCKHQSDSPVIRDVDHILIRARQSLRVHSSVFSVVLLAVIGDFVWGFICVMGCVCLSVTLWVQECGAAGHGDEAVQGSEDSGGVHVVRN